LRPRRLIIVVIMMGLMAFVLFEGRNKNWFGAQNTPSTAQSSLQPGQNPVTVVKAPPVVTTRTFDPAAPPAEMPPLAPGEIAVCDADFVSNANVAGVSRRVDDTHAVLRITRVMIGLQLKITIWLPQGVTDHVKEHEDGHRQIAEHYYATADQVAQRIGDAYIDKQVQIEGEDPAAEGNKALGQMAADITATYNKELNPSPAQLLYDSFTDHSRNDSAVSDAVAAAINQSQLEAVPASQPAVN